jgi:uncharacterized cupin superfamily protein
MAVPEARLESTELGLVPAGEGWFVVNAREAPWNHAPGRSTFCHFEGDAGFPQLGFNVSVLGPGEPMAMYHWEADQEGFLVVAGEALLIVEGQERRLRAWDFFHCPAGTEHAIVGAGDGRCVMVAVGARDHWYKPDWGAYTVSEAALRHGAGVERETTDEWEAYDGLPHRRPVAYRDGWLP